MVSNEPQVLTPRGTNDPSAALCFLFLLDWCCTGFPSVVHLSSFSVCQEESCEGMLRAGLVASAIFSKACFR